MTAFLPGRFRGFVSKNWSLLDITFYVSVTLAFFESLIQATQFRYAFGDGAYKFLFVYSRVFENLPFDYFNDSRISRDSIVGFRQLLAYGVIKLGGNLSSSFVLFSILANMTLFILIILTFILLKKTLTTINSFVISMVLLALTIYTLSFPDAEILMAAPISIMWTASIIYCCNSQNQRSIRLKFVLILFNLFIAHELHEIMGLISLFASMYLILVLQFESFRFVNSILIISTLYVSFKVIDTLLAGFSSLPTSNQLFDVAWLFNPGLWFYKPLLTLLFVFTLLSFLPIGINTNPKNSKRLMVIVLAMSAFSAYLQYRVYRIEERRVNNVWSFVENRQDLAWFALLTSIFILINRFLRTIKFYSWKRTSFLTEKMFAFRFFIAIVITINVAFSLILRHEEHQFWFLCKQSQHEKNINYTGIVSRSEWGIRECDWVWADPGTYYLMFPESSSKRLPASLINPEESWPPEASFSGTGLSIFGFDLPLNP